MPKQYEQFKHDYEAIKQGVVAGELEITKEKTNRGHLDNQLAEHAREIGRRVRVLRENGTPGTTISAFDKDPQVHKLLGEIDQYLAQIEAVNKRIRAHETGDWQKLAASYTALQKDLTAEIAARKKQLSTKLGTGNKSLPDMEKLLTESGTISKRVTALAKYSLAAKKLMDVSVNKRRVEDSITTELSKSQSEALTEDQAEIFQSLLSDRNLKFAFASAKSACLAVITAVSEAETAHKANQAQALKDAQAKGAQAIKRLDEVVDKYQRAYHTLGDAVILTNKQGPAIKQTVASMGTLKQRGHTEMAKMPKT